MLRNTLIVLVAVLLVTAPVGAVTDPQTLTDSEYRGQVEEHPAVTAQSNEDPDPVMQVSAPDEVTVGETFELSVWAENRGGDAGAYSTISISSPSFTGSDGGSRFENPESDLGYLSRISEGEEIFDDSGNSMTAQYALVEAGTTGDGDWGSNEEQSLSVEITPKEAGELVFYVRTTLSDDGDNSRKFTAPWNGDTEDQQGFQVRRIVVDVQEEKDISAEIEWFDVDTGSFSPGETVTAETKVRNTGNREHTFYVGYGFTGPNGEPYSNDGTTHEPVTLQPGESRTVDLSWTVPENAPEGEYSAETVVWQENQDGLLDGELDRASGDQSVTVATESINAEIDSISAPQQSEVRPGDTIETTVTIENTGDLAHDFWVDASVMMPNGQWVTGSGRYVSIGRGDTRRVTLSVTIPEDAPSGNYAVGAAAYRTSDKAQSYDNGATPDAFEVQTVDQTPKATFEGANLPSGEFASGDRVTSTVYVTNTGEVSHEFVVGYSAFGPNGGVYDNGGTSHKRVELAPGETRQVELALTLPDSAPTGAYDIEASLWTGMDGADLTGHLDTVSAREAFAVVGGEVTIDGVEVIPASPQVDEETAVRVSLSNTGGAPIDDARVVVELGDNRREATIDLPAQTSDYIIVEFRPESAGQQRLSVEVTADGQQREETRDVRVESQTVTVAGQVRDLDGDGVSNAEVVLGEQTIETDDSGRFQIENVPVSVETIEVRTDRGAITKDIALATDSENYVRVTVGSEGSLEVANQPDGYTIGEEFEVTYTIRNDGDQASSYILNIPAIPGLELEGDRQRIFELAPGEQRDISVRLTPTADYDGAPIRATLAGPEGSPIETSELNLEKSKTEVVVTVIDSQGDPVEGVSVGLLQGEKHETQPNGVTRFVVSPPSESGNEAWRTWFAFTAEEYNKDSVESVTIQPGEVNEVIFRLPASGQVQGEVLANGEGLEEVTVAINGEEIRTASDGYFEFPESIPPGNYYIRVKKNDQVILREIVSVNKGYNNFRLRVSEQRYESATGVSPYVKGVVNSMLTSGTDEVKSEIYGDVDEDARVSQADPEGEFFTTEDGAYYTAGPCAWYSSEEQCEASGIKGGGEEESARALSEGMVTGFIYGGEETVNGFRELLRPIQYVQDMYKVVVSLLKDFGLLEEMLRAVPQQIKDAQQEDNPYTPGTSAHTDFASGWYGGYITWMIAATAVSGGAAGASTKFLSSSSKFSKAMDAVKEMSDSAKKQAVRRATDTISDGASQIADSLDAFDSDTADVLRRLHKQSELDSETVQELASLKRNNGKFTDVEAEALLELYRLRYQNNLVDADIEGDDLIHLAKDGTPSEVEIVVKRDNEVYWVEEGLTKSEAAELPDKSGPVGFKHIMEKHGSEFLDKPGIDNKKDVKRVIYKTIENGERVGDGRKTRFRWVRDDGQEFFVGYSENGFIINARTGGDVSSSMVSPATVEEKPNASGLSAS